MHYFITGHTGFKGSWLILLLRELGHEVSGFSLPAVDGGLFNLADLETQLKHHFIGDIRDLGAIKSALEISQPDFAIHMAAQPLVLRSYADPIETYTTNVTGTLNFLDAITGLRVPPVSLVVTTDKVYRDDGQGAYVENDALGGHDPYSASKAMADLLAQSWAATNPNLKINIARAGNVIGAFDVSENRLIPDLVRAIQSGDTLTVRQPSAVRPWQHVLDCLTGYLLFLRASNGGQALPIALNFGPDPANIKSVSHLLEAAQVAYQDLVILEDVSSEKPKETQLLTLDSTKAQSLLKWRNLIDFQDAVSWSLAELTLDEPLELARSQVAAFLLRGAGKWLS